MKGYDRPIVLTFIGNYLPGYKAGGMLRSMVNAVENLSSDMEFWIVTMDRDLGDSNPYDDIKIDQWQRVGSAMVYYLSPQSSTLKNIRHLILRTKHNVLYLNSFFDPLTIKVLLIRKFRKSSFQPVIVAPRGVFASAALKLKYPKKLVFILFAGFIGLYKNITWHASSDFEEDDIIKIMKIRKEYIHNALDLPTKFIPDHTLILPMLSPSDNSGLRLVFISRIARVKNLDYALQILSRVKAKVFFDIYGPLEDMKYWSKCQELIKQLPSNIKVQYLGIVNPNQVVQIFSRYDLFLFPSCGENYGHVIAESLTSGTPVLISDKTPWRNLKNYNLGLDISLDQKDSFIEEIERFALMNNEVRLKMRVSIKSFIDKHLLDTEVLEANRQLFLKQLNQ